MPAYCQGNSPTFAPMVDGQLIVPGNRIITPTFNFGYMTGAAMGNISGPQKGNRLPLSMTKPLLYDPPDVNLQLFAHFLPWFDVTTNRHVNVGYNSNDPNTVFAQLSDIRDRAFTGLIIDWYGPPLSGGAFVTEDGTTQKIASTIRDPSFSQLSFALMEDAGSWNAGPPNPNCQLQDANQPTCIQNKIQNDLLYADQQYFGKRPLQDVLTSPVNEGC